MKTDITPRELWTVRYEQGGWSREQAWQYLNVDRRTYERWEDGRSRIPFMAYELLRIAAAGELPTADPVWAGWRFFRDKLVSPERVEFGAGEIRALPYLWALVHHYQHQSDTAANDVEQHAARDNVIIPFPVARVRRAIEHEP